MIRQNLAANLILLAVAGLAHGAGDSKPEVLIRVFEAGPVSPRTLVLRKKPPPESLTRQVCVSAGRTSVQSPGPNR